MNERIKELEKQCWQSIQSEPYALFDVKKFAELIVRECAKCMTTPKIQAEWPHDVAVKIIIDTLAQDMCEHFGVEE